MFIEKIPLELRQFAQWINWKYATIDGKQTKIPLRPVDGRKASVIQPCDWSTFEKAVETSAFCDGIGFVFTLTDPFCGIDLDNKTNDPAIRDYQQQIMSHIDSYTELSPSGSGLHIICRAKLPGKGRRKGHIEIYDNARFFTFTGNAVNNLPINDCPDAISLWENLGGTEYVETSQEDYAETLSDAEIIERAAAAANGEKFLRLYSGDWQTDYSTKSQSEADFALINILAFYSRNRTQIVRLFRASGLGQRPKAQRGAYVGTMVRRAFDRMPPLVSGLPGSGPWFDASLYEPWQIRPTEVARLRHSAPHTAPAPTPPTPTLSPALDQPMPDALPPIPGLVGDLMRHCWNRSCYQIPQVSIASALTSMSLLVGRSHRLGTEGLSLYVLLLAKTSVGKDFAFQAQQIWRNALLKRYSDPASGANYKARRDFLSNMIVNKIGSGPGIEQHILRYPSTLMQLDEFVNDIVEMARPQPNANVESIKQSMLTIYSQGKPGITYVERRYSQRNTPDKELKSVMSACLTLLANGTPGVFYDNLRPAMLENGLIPRFIILEYEGGRPNRNENVTDEMDLEFIANLDQYFNHLFNLTQEMTGDLDQIIEAHPNERAKEEFDKWYDYCNARLKAAHNEGHPTAGLWSRADTHVRQIAALIAIGVNRSQPVITDQYVRLAIDIVKPSAEGLSKKVIANEVGVGDARCEAEILKFLHRIYSEGYDFVRGYGKISDAVVRNRGERWVQLGLVKWYVKKFSAFSSRDFRANQTFDQIVRSMVDSGDLEQKQFYIVNGRKIVAVRTSEAL